jgi:hypothetical protein
VKVVSFFACFIGKLHFYALQILYFCVISILFIGRHGFKHVKPEIYLFLSFAVAILLTLYQAEDRLNLCHYFMFVFGGAVDGAMHGQSRATEEEKYYMCLYFF